MEKDAERKAERGVAMAVALAKGAAMFDQPTDIVGFGEVGRCLARWGVGIVGRKEMCYCDFGGAYACGEAGYHFLEFDKMLEKCEYMFVTEGECAEWFEDLTKLRPQTKVVILAEGFEAVAERMAEMVEAGRLGGVAFMSAEPAMLRRKWRGNVVVVAAEV